jgi:histone deacetylase complex regulatory component SIN3
MIALFEELTYQITDNEKLCAKFIEAVLRKTNKFYTNKQLRKLIFERSGNDTDFDLADSRIRVIMNYLRRTTAPNIIASSNGYKITEDIDELNKYLESLYDRIDAIKVIADQTSFYVKQYGAQR